MKGIKQICTLACFCLSGLSSETCLFGLSTGSFDNCVVSSSQLNPPFGRSSAPVQLRCWWAKGHAPTPSAPREHGQGGSKSMCSTRPCLGGKTSAQHWEHSARQMSDTACYLGERHWEKKSSVSPKINKRQCRTIFLVFFQISFLHTSSLLCSNYAAFFKDLVLALIPFSS